MIEDISLSSETILDFARSNTFRSINGYLPDELSQKVLRYGAPVGSKVEIHSRIPRCMERLKDLIDEAEQANTSLSSGAIVMAGELGSGSGRFDRDWFAPAGGLWMAMAWADTLLPDYARLLPLATGAACCEAVRYFGIDAAVKWVNDIHVQGRKIGGILCETHNGKNRSERYHLVGIGINCNVHAFPPELDGSAVSMHEIINRPVDLQEFAVVLLANLAWNFGLVHLQEETDLADKDGIVDTSRKGIVVDTWCKLSDSVGRRVMYGYDVVRNPLYRATVVDIDNAGGLVLRLDSGEEITEYSGEVRYLD